MRRLPPLLFCSSLALFHWKGWDPKFAKEVVPGAHPVNPIPINTIDLLKYTKAQGVMFIQGSPSCGKSSLARLIKREAVTSGFYGEVFVSQSNKTAVVAKMNALEAAGEQDNCLFIVDEAQREIIQGHIDASGMFKGLFHVMYFGTTTRTTDEFTTPAELEPHKHWMYAPSVDRQIVRDFAARVLDHHGAETEEAIRLAEQAFDFAGASMGVLIKTLHAIVDRKGTFPTPNDLLLRAKYQPRVVVNGETKWQEDPAKTAIAQELLAVGKVRVGPDSPQRWKDLLRCGFICPLRNFDSDESIIPWSADSVDVGWAHTWQVTYCRLCDPAITPHRYAWLPEATMQAPVDAVLRFLPSFDVETLIPNVINAAALNTTEYNFQAQFVAAVKRTCPELTLSNEVQVHNAQGELIGRLDFVLQLHSDTKGNVSWGFELLVRSRKLQDHKKRFTPDGKYKTLPLADYLVLDYHTEPLLATDADCSDKVATISPHIAEGWNVIVLDYLGKRVNIPRDGVPRYVADWTAAAPGAKVAVKLFAPTHNVLLRFGSGTGGKLVRVPDMGKGAGVIQLKGWLMMNVKELKSTAVGDLVVSTTDSKVDLVGDTDPVVDTTVDPTKTHYYVFVQ